MAATPDPPQTDTAVELMCIKALLQNIASSMSELKSGMDAVQTTVEKLGARMAEAETHISALEDKDQSMGAMVETATKTIALLQEKVTYLEDAGRHNNVRVVGIAEEAEGRDMQQFVRTFLEETLSIEMGLDF